METVDAHTWLDEEIRLHGTLAPRVAAALRAAAQEHSIPFLTIDYRVKTLPGALEKITRKQYSRPKEQLTDLSGVRIVTYLEDHVEAIERAISRTFAVDKKHSSRRDAELGVDRIGYRSRHFVCTHTGDEEPSLRHLKFEIQVRTVLQHAWAELAHDNTFKIDVALPEELQRKLNLHAATLELADRGFQEIFDAAELYRAKLAAQSHDDFLSAEVDSISLYQYLDRLADRLGIAKLDGDLEKSVINEVLSFGLDRIADIDNLVTQRFITDYEAVKVASNSYRGLVRLIMMHTDLERYLKVPHEWTGMLGSTYEFLKRRYGRDRVDRLLRRYEIDMIS